MNLELFIFSFKIPGSITPSEVASAPLECTVHILLRFLRGNDTCIPFWGLSSSITSIARNYGDIGIGRQFGTLSSWAVL